MKPMKTEYNVVWINYSNLKEVKKILDKAEADLIARGCRSDSIELDAYYDSIEGQVVNRVIGRRPLTEDEQLKQKQYLKTSWSK